MMDKAPYSTALVEYVREHISSVEVPWLKERLTGEYMPVQTNPTQSSVPIVQDKAEITKGVAD